MGLTVEYRLRSPRLPLCDVARAVPDVALSIAKTRTADPRSPVLFLSVDGSLDAEVVAALEDALSRSSTVAEFSSVARTPLSATYRIAVASSMDDATLARLELSRVFIEAIVVEADGWRVRAQFANRNELRAYREFYRERGLDFRVLQLSRTRSDRRSPTRLSTRQREAVLVAHRMGYFDIPRAVTLLDVADELGISKPALAERLRRAEKRLVEEYVASSRPHENANTC